jgi:hypothetical protein
MPSKTTAEKKDRLTPDRLERFVARLNKYPQQKERVINDLLKQGFSATVSEYFALNAHQKRELQTVSDRDNEAIVIQGVLAALRRNGKIELAQEGHNPPNMRMEIGFTRGGDGSIGVHVRFTC